MRYKLKLLDEKKNTYRMHFIIITLQHTKKYIKRFYMNKIYR